MLICSTKLENKPNLYKNKISQIYQNGLLSIRNCSNCYIFFCLWRHNIKNAVQYKTRIGLCLKVCTTFFGVISNRLKNKKLCAPKNLFSDQYRTKSKTKTSNMFFQWIFLFVYEDVALITVLFLYLSYTFAMYL